MMKEVTDCCNYEIWQFVVWIFPGFLGWCHCYSGVSEDMKIGPWIHAEERNFFCKMDGLRWGLEPGASWGITIRSSRHVDMAEHSTENPELTQGLCCSICNGNTQRVFPSKGASGTPDLACSYCNTTQTWMDASWIKTLWMLELTACSERLEFPALRWYWTASFLHVAEESQNVQMQHIRNK